MVLDQVVSSVKVAWLTFWYEFLGGEKYWKVVRNLGSGYYGEVWEIKHGDRNLALKHNIRRTDEEIQQELAVGQEIWTTQPSQSFSIEYPVWNHSTAMVPKREHHLPSPYKDEYLRRRFGENFIVTGPIADGRTLREFLHQHPRPTDKVLKRIMGCLISGLSIMHDKGIHHHDIHTKNILVHKNSPLYNDFGLETDHEPSNCSGADVDDDVFMETKSAERDVLLLAGALIEILALLTENDILANCEKMRGSRSKKLSNPDFNGSLRATLTELKQTNQFPSFMDLVLTMLDFKNRRSSWEVVQMLVELEGDDSICETCHFWYKERITPTQMIKKRGRIVRFGGSEDVVFGLMQPLFLP